MPKAKPISLHPLKFEDALKALLTSPPKKKDKTARNGRKKKAQAE